MDAEMRSAEEKADLAIKYVKTLLRRVEVLQEQIDHLMDAVRAQRGADRETKLF